VLFVCARVREGESWGERERGWDRNKDSGKTAHPLHHPGPSRLLLFPIPFAKICPLRVGSRASEEWLLSGKALSWIALNLKPLGSKAFTMVPNRSTLPL
jgi:hypothetical protein